MNSNATIEHNEEQYLQVVKVLDPDLYFIRTALQETGLNATIVTRVIRGIANLAYGSGYGRVQVFMSKGIVTQVKAEESDTLNIKAMEE